MDQRDENDPLWKIDSFLSEFMERCQHYWSLSEFISLDEMMIRFSGRSKMVFKQQPKPTPNGFKVIGIVDAEIPYVYHGIIDQRDKKAKAEIIYDLCDSFCTENVGRTLVIDRGYMTLGLVLNLLNLGLFAVGTIKRHANIPAGLRNAKATSSRKRALRCRKKSQPEDEEEEDDDEITHDDVTESDSRSWKDFRKEGLKKGQYLYLSQPNLTVTAWHDSGICLCVSSRHGSEAGLVERKVKGFVGKVTRTAPKMIEDYNKYMGGCDTADNMRVRYCVNRISKKWWHPIFFWILDVSISNAWILSNLKSKTFGRLEFLDMIIHCLLEDGEPRNVHHHMPEFKVTAAGKSLRCCHHMVKFGNEGWCSMMCDTCLVQLCIHCFKEYHLTHIYQ
jgi:hypothetical protein